MSTKPLERFPLKNAGGRQPPKLAVPSRPIIVQSSPVQSPAPSWNPRPGPRFRENPPVGSGITARSASSWTSTSSGVAVWPRVTRLELEPAPAPQRLLAACRRAFGGPGTVTAPDDVVHIRDILDKMEPGDVHLRAVTKAAAASGPRTHPIITRTTIYKCKNFSIVIFLLPRGAVIPLHDHPGMTVFSKLLLGSLHVTSYDWADADDGPPAAGGGNPLLRLGKRVVDADLSAPCDALVLFPESGGNMHRFAAATACAVLDVLGPPYSRDRDCTYYQELPYHHHHHHHDDNADEAAGDGEVVPAATEDEQMKARLGWLLETRKPKELLMYEVPYRGPPILWKKKKKRPAVDSWQQRFPHER